MNSTILCPKCQTPISIDEAMSHQLEESIKKEFDLQRSKEREEERKKMVEWKESLEKKTQETQDKLKLELEEQLKKQILEESELDQKRLKEELEDKKKQLQEQKDKELSLLKRQEEIEEKSRNIELEAKRQVAQERGKIQEEAEKRVKDELQLSLAEKDKMLADALKANDDLKQKLTQGSQQLQGEILELELEQLLGSEFAIDDIAPVGKGINGADLIQTVKDSNGKSCGTIIWESKRTKHWDEKWVSKLKDDMRAAKCDLAIIVTTALPQGINNFGPKDGIYITNFDNFLAVAQVMRIKLIELCHMKEASSGVNDKKEILWNYLTSNEFKQRMEVIVDVFSDMKSVIDKEKLFFTKKWAQEEKMIEKVLASTVGMHGDLQGLMGASLPQIKSLDMDNFELIETTQIEITTVIEKN